MDDLEVVQEAMFKLYDQLIPTAQNCDSLGFPKESNADS